MLLLIGIWIAPLDWDWWIGALIGLGTPFFVVILTAGIVNRLWDRRTAPPPPPFTPTSPGDLVPVGETLELELTFFPDDLDPKRAAREIAERLGTKLATEWIGMFEAVWTLEFEDASLELWWVEWPESMWIAAEGPAAKARLERVRAELFPDWSPSGVPTAQVATARPATDRTASILGCLLGGALGDALGGPYENRTPPFELDSTVPLRLSDDTQFTLATCEAIGPGADPEPIAANFLAWYRARRFTGLGASTLKALRDLDAGAHWALAGRQGEFAAGNGAAMRAAPFAFCLNLSSEEGRRTLRDVCWITHQSDEAYAGALAVALAVRAMVNGSWQPGDSLVALVAAELPDTNTRDKLLAVAALPSDTPIADVARRTGTTAYVAESVPLAIFAASRAPALGLKQALRQVIHAGGDTDTIASMTGQIAGAWFGPPEEGELHPPEADAIERIARAFAQRLESP